MIEVGFRIAHSQFGSIFFYCPFSYRSLFLCLQVPQASDTGWQDFLFRLLSCTVWYMILYNAPFFIFQPHFFTEKCLILIIFLFLVWFGCFSFACSGFFLRLVIYAKQSPTLLYENLIRWIFWKKFNFGDKIDVIFFLNEELLIRNWAQVGIFIVNLIFPVLPKGWHRKIA